MKSISVKFSQVSSRLSWLRRVFNRRSLALALSSAAVVSLHATSVIDSFNDISGGSDGLSLVSLNTSGIGGVGFTTKYEQTGSGVIVLRTNDQTVSLTNYISNQASNSQHWSVAATITTSGAARRTQTRSTPPMSGTIWFSFIANLLTTNGDVALVFNGGFNSGGSGSPASANPTTGMRVGLGSFSRPNFRQALGVGPATALAVSLELSNIVNGVNGAVTSAGFIPVATPVLILGRIDSDPANSLPRVSLWYNPDVPSAASLPAPTLTFTDSTGTNVPSTVTRIGYQVNRSSAPATQNEAIDNVKVSDEPNGFDIVYKSAPLPTPTISVIGTTLIGSEAGPTNLVFSVQSSSPVPAPLTVTYILSGLATNGYDGQGGFTNADYTDPNFDTNTIISSVTIPQGQTNATVTLQVIDDAIPEGTEPVILTLQTSVNYILGSPSTVTGNILDNNDANVSVQYMFNHNVTPQVFDTNMIAFPADVAGVGAGTYSGNYFYSPDAAYSVPGNVTGSNADQAVANGNYMGIKIAPVPGRALTLTNFNFEAVYGNFQFEVPSAASATVFVRSSLDGFTTNLAEFTLQPDNIVFPNVWYSNYVALGSEFSNVPGQVEFRLYFYDDSDNNQVGVRVDNIYFNGTTSVLPPGINQVMLGTNIVNAAEPSTSGQFTISRVGSVTNLLTVNYIVTGTASNGVDYVLLPGSITIPTGQSNTVISVIPIDDQIAEATKTVTLTLVSGTNYGILSPSSATVNLADDGDLGPGAIITYFFNEDDNTPASLFAIAAPSVHLTNSVMASNVLAGPGLGAFGRNGVGIGNGYADTLSFSPPSTLFVRAEVWSTNASDALTNADYLSFNLGPTSAHTISLTNFSLEVKMTGAAGQSASLFLRSSADNFATDLGTVTVSNSLNADPWSLWNVPLAVSNSASALEFRLYFYGSRINTSDLVRLDDATFYGSAAVNSAPTTPHISRIAIVGGNVQISFTGGAEDPASAFALQTSLSPGGGFADVAATIVAAGPGSFTATIAPNGNARFYRIRR